MKRRPPPYLLTPIGLDRNGNPLYRTAGPDYLRILREGESNAWHIVGNGPAVDVPVPEDAPRITVDTTAVDGSSTAPARILRGDDPNYPWSNWPTYAWPEQDDRRSLLGWVVVLVVIALTVAGYWVSWAYPELVGELLQVLGVKR